MPRTPRPVLPGQSLHLIQRGNNRSRCFIDDVDREYYKSAVLSASARSGCSIHAYVMMTNHVHLLVTAGQSHSPARMMQSLGRTYVRYYNDRHDRSGTLWEGRYRSTLVDTERYFLACSRYIETNPLRAGLSVQPQQYRWSSFRCNAHGDRDPLVTPHAVYCALGKDDLARQSSYRALFSVPLDPDDVEAIRSSTNTGAVLGSDSRRAAFEAALGRSLRRASHGGDRRSSSFTPGLPSK
jgi:putative transposase